MIGFSEARVFMYFKKALIVCLTGIILQACTPTGPVRLYDDATKTPDQIARVKVPGPVTMLRVDNRKVRSPSKDEGFYELHLDPGVHRLTFEYKLYWGTTIDGMMIVSEPAVITHNFVAGKVYELVYEEPGSLDEADDMARNFQATLVEVGGDARIVSHSNTDLAAVPLYSSGPAAASTPDIAAPMPSAEQAVNEDAVKRLKFWWLMASDAERDEFRKWMKQDMPEF